MSIGESRDLLRQAGQTLEDTQGTIDQLPDKAAELHAGRDSIQQAITEVHNRIAALHDRAIQAFG